MTPKIEGKTLLSDKNVFRAKSLGLNLILIVGAAIMLTPLLWMLI